MEKSIVEKLQETLDKNSNTLETSEKVKEYEEGLSMFNDLIEEGKLKPRGYNLLTVDKAHLNRQVFNVK